FHSHTVTHLRASELPTGVAGQKTTLTLGTSFKTFPNFDPDEIFPLQNKYINTDTTAPGRSVPALGVGRGL
ncbi:hypothetical protein M8C21_032312, partial [Ambrosia artemisiifolia]